jgi:predicted DNA binding protein
LTMFEITFKLKHDCPYTELSRRLPELNFAHWCNNQKDVLEVSCEDKDLATFEDLQKNIKALEQALSVKIVRRASGSNSAQLVTTSCNCWKIGRSVTPHIEKNNCLAIKPTFYKGGWEWYRILAFRQKDLKILFQELEAFTEFEVLSRRKIINSSVKEAFVISTSSIVGGLTYKQAFALLTAMTRGYYEIPKRTSTEDIANSLHLPRTTYEEHLRKAESKVMKAVAPFLELGSTSIHTRSRRDEGPREVEKMMPQIRA